MATEILRKHLENFLGDAWLVKNGDKYFVVSGVNAMFSGWEVLVFPADEHGEVTSWSEVAGGRGITHEEAIADLENTLVGSVQLHQEEKKL
jgi:hypothetical protein